MDDIHVAYASLVLSWNYEGEAPPAEGGPEQADLLTVDAVIGIAQQVSQRMAEAAPQRFLRTVKMLTDLRRIAPSVYVGQQQVNMGHVPNEIGGDSIEPPK